MTDENNLDEPFLTKSKFAKMVETIVADKDVSHIEAIVMICEEHGIEIEDSKKYVSSVLKGKLEVEAMQLNYIPKQNTLPID